MKLSDTTLEVIKNFSSINQSILFKPGKKLSTISANRTVLAIANLDQEIDNEFGIYELGKFLGVLNLLKDPSIDSSTQVLKIRAENKTIRYTCADPRTFRVPPEGEYELGNIFVQFTLEPDVFSSVLKAISILGHSQFGILGENGKLMLQALNTDNPSGDIYSVEIGETDKDFLATISRDCLRMLPGRYEVKINADGMSAFISDRVTYYIPLQDSSRI